MTLKEMVPWRWGGLRRWDDEERPFESFFREMDSLHKEMEEHKFDAIIHFAAHAYVGESMSDPLKYYDNNVKKTISLIIRIVQEKIPYFIFSSSCSVYGLPNSLPIEECHPVSPISPYGRSKVIIEQILNDCFHAYGLNSISLRYFNAAGADPDNELGEYHNPETHLIPNVLNAALNPEKSIIVFGTDYPTLDGTCIRDYLHVSDIAESHVLALQYIDTNKRETADQYCRNWVYHSWQYSPAGIRIQEVRVLEILKATQDSDNRSSP